ncbi:MAG: hypothetical protein GWN18_12095, partial [Thermoplasmata archaeon]|nr:hypothetical protein [Thermoplasmata archaeon]NIS12799.1 hypothetical protein [Thermoplasmata archaeon]NIS20700.1 hypothetical protein [Thermoplasmata archaeon]NIT78104.1 hypothetical protein [Thermoplasmata archaeon]NIU49775.1 hypothetical protein [Thermoplasmata archaeon]
MVTESGSILYANPSLSKRGRDQRGWSRTEGHHVCEVFDDEHQDQVREWYEELKERGDRFGILELRSRRGDVTERAETLTAIRLEDVELVVVRSREDLPVMDRYRDLETSARILNNYLRDGNLGLMVLQDEDDRRAVIRYVSPEGADILERDVGALTGLELEGFLDPGHREPILERCRTRARGESYLGDNTIRFLNPQGDLIVL